MLKRKVTGDCRKLRNEELNDLQSVRITGASQNSFTLVTLVTNQGQTFTAASVMPAVTLHSCIGRVRGCARSGRGPFNALFQYSP